MANIMALASVYYIIQLRPTGSEAIQDIHVIGLYAITGGKTGMSKKVAVEMGLSDIKQEAYSSLLPGYRLVMHLGDSKVSAVCMSHFHLG